MLSRCRQITLRQMIAAALWLLWFTCSLAMVQNSLRIQQLYPGASLRYNTPITAEAAQNARAYANQSTGNAFWPSYWAEEQLPLSSSLATVNSYCLWFCGDANQFFQAPFLDGAHPAPADSDGISISTELAWQLWGSHNAVGNEVMVNGRPYLVRGVFENAKAMALIGTATTNRAEGWQAVALAGTPEGDLRTEAETFALASGLGQPDTLLAGPVFSGLAQLAALLPCFVLLVIGLVSGLRFITKKHPRLKNPLLFALLLGTAAAAPLLLNRLPISLIPTRWSDFSFWTRLANQWSSQFNSYLMLRPTYPDALVKQALLVQLLLLFVSVTVLILLPLAKRPALPALLPAKDGTLEEATAPARILWKSPKQIAEQDGLP